MIYVLWKTLKSSLFEFSGFFGFKRGRGNEVAAMNMNSNLKSNKSEETKNCNGEVPLKDDAGNQPHLVQQF